MATIRGRARWILGAMAGLLLALTPGPGEWPLGQGAKAATSKHEIPDRRLNITVEEGRLSVDVKDADVRELLAELGRQADITIFFESVARKRVSTRFSEMDLERGLRRLLELVSLNHVIVYYQGPAGTVAVKEIRVFRETDDENVGDAVSQFPMVVAQTPAGSPGPATGEESEAARRFREALEGAGQKGRSRVGGPETRQGPLSPATGEESEAARRFREALGRAQQQGSSAVGGVEARQGPFSPPTGDQSEAARRFREALERAKQRD